MQLKTAGDEKLHMASELHFEEDIEKTFTEFKSKVGKQISDSDFQAHYELGIAYLEMGFYDDAISQFKKNTDEESFRKQSLPLIALCQAKKGDWDGALENCRQAVSIVGLPNLQKQALLQKLNQMSQGEFNHKELIQILDQFLNIHGKKLHVVNELKSPERSDLTKLEDNKIRLSNTAKIGYL
jgi:tetratricopeptide (TPR) repeat protein